jgi:hypothetical protein
LRHYEAIAGPVVSSDFAECSQSKSADECGRRFPRADDLEQRNLLTAPEEAFLLPNRDFARSH